MTKLYRSWFWLSLALLAGSLPARPLNAQTINAQTINSAQAPTLPLPRPTAPLPPQDVIPIPPQTQPSPPSSLPPQLPPPGELLQPSTPTTPNAEPPSENVPEAITVERFEVVGSTVFSQQDFDNLTKPYTKRPLSLPELFEVRSKVTELYVKSGYITSGAYIPPQPLEGGVVKIQVSEGGLEDIKVTGTHHLNPNYVRSRLAIATTRPLNQKRLLEALQLLQLNPLIKAVSAELSAGTTTGENLLSVNITEATIWDVQISLDNGRTPSVGTFRRQIQLTNADLLGLGDRLSLAYTNTDGSNAFDASYTIPFNPRNGTIALSGGFAFSRVIEPPFDVLDINSNSNYVELTVRQPILQSTTQEFALGLTVSHRESGATLLGGEIPFPAVGSDDQGNTRITALRFFQDYTLRNQSEVLAFRSQFSVGISALNATINAVPPDGNFFVWRGQAQYVRLLAPDTLLLLRGDIQLADRPLVPLEQFGLGGQESVRGYRQDQLFTDSGIFASAEVRIPILRLPSFGNAVLQLYPFVDVGHGFNRGSGTNPSPNTLVSVGLGLRFQAGDRITARFDWGIPLTNVSGEKNTLQEQGFYFSLLYNQPF
ncbi:ShlB/FhaC/HecB family hemolysin secretion/activation protein [Stenomitos frigidus]|uniref:Hemolysin activation/secretion protein n=1 Tax=Stenomitos frigidus ULC18 TaxID=2107698 RepID=A0A2T1EJY1_9CYAN|nr:ShlB/FhaC/HecB family hemolysin secretion/activation protein [Stenomitos frigidus]PSB33072.1 hemolysin activation/secretion protein [Stenomitos frigidus ULC18]